MTDQHNHAERVRRAPVATRIAPEALAKIEQLADERRTTIGQVTRCLIEDGVKALASQGTF
jgi:hypothetical protein